MRADEIHRQIEASPLADRVDRVMALVRPAVRMLSYLVEVDDLPPGASRMGGMPDLPPGAPWPEHEGRPLDFLAQIDLAEAARAYPVPGLPVTGWLAVFYDLGAPYDRKVWSVTHFESKTASLLRREPPGGLAQKLNFCELQFEREDCVPDLSDLFSDDMPDDHAWHDATGDDNDWKDDAWDACEKLNERINDAEGPKPVHRLGGYPMLIQSSDSDFSSSNWEFLLQIDSDFELGWMWGDMGRLFFWTQRASAPDRKFGPTWCGEEFY